MSTHLGNCWRQYAMLSHSVMSDSPGIAACQAPLSMEFSSQEYCSGLPFPSPGDLPDPGIKSSPLASPALAGGLFTTSITWETLWKCWSLNCVWLFVTPWTVTHQTPLSMEFSRQEYWVGCHSLLQRIFPTQGSNLGLPHYRQILHLLSQQRSPVLRLPCWILPFHFTWQETRPEGDVWSLN